MAAKKTSNPAVETIGAAPNRHAAARYNGRLHTVVAEVSNGGIPIAYRANIDDDAPLARYLRRGLISERQFDAGAHLAGLFTRAVKPPKVTMGWNDKTSGGGRLDADEFAAAAVADGRSALYSALHGAGLAGPVTSGENEGVGLTPLGSVVLSVCGYEEFAGGTRRLNRLRDGLDALADHFGLPNPDTDTERARIGKYIAPGPRPTDNPEARDLSWSRQQNEKREKVRLIIANKRARKAQRASITETDS